MKKKGFTLIELLAVIVIMAIIATITSIVVINIINDQRRNSNEISIGNIIEAAKNYYSTAVLKSSTGIFNNGKLKTIEFPTTDIKYDGQKATEGELTISTKGDIDITKVIKLGDYYCGYDETDTEVKCDLDSSNINARVPRLSLVINATNKGNKVSGTTIEVKDSTSQVVSPKGEVYKLKEGNYTYSVTAFGYATITGSIEVTEEMILNSEHTINVSLVTCQENNSCKFGDIVRLSDDSLWIIINTDYETSSKAVLFSAYNLKNSDGIFEATTGRTTANTTGEWSQDPTDKNQTAISSIAFDNDDNRYLSGSYCDSWYGCNAYASKDSATLSERVPGDSLAKKYVDAYHNQLKNKGVLNSTSSMRLLKLDEVCSIIKGYNPTLTSCSITTWDAFDFMFEEDTYIPEWLTWNTYWLMTPYSGSNDETWTIKNIYEKGYIGYDYCSYAYNNQGLRPVIEVDKSFSS